MENTTDAAESTLHTPTALEDAKIYLGAASLTNGHLEKSLAIEQATAYAIVSIAESLEKLCERKEL